MTDMNISMPMNGGNRVELKMAYWKKGIKTTKRGTSVLFYPDDNIFESVDFVTRVDRK